jgi:hypothetical protein
MNHGFIVRTRIEAPFDRGFAASTVSVLIQVGWVARTGAGPVGDRGRG